MFKSATNELANACVVDKLFGPENAPIHTTNASTDCSGKLRVRLRDRIDSSLFPLSAVADERVFKRERFSIYGCCSGMRHVTR